MLKRFPAFPKLVAQLKHKNAANILEPDASNGNLRTKKQSVVEIASDSKLHVVIRHEHTRSQRQLPSSLKFGAFESELISQMLETNNIAPFEKALKVVLQQPETLLESDFLNFLLTILKDTSKPATVIAIVLKILNIMLESPLLSKKTNL